MLHSSVSDINGSEGEFKVYGRATITDDPAARNHPDAWWSSRPPDKAGVFAMDISEAVLVAWNPEFDRMQTTRWTADRGASSGVRTYP